MSCAKPSGFQRQPNMDARVVELVDSLASGASARKGVRVRLPPRAPTKVAEKDATPETLAAARVSAVSEGKIEYQSRWRCKSPFL